MSSPTGSTLNRVLKLVCGVLILFVISHLVLSLASIPLYYHRVTTGSVPELIVGGQIKMSNELVAQWAAERNMSLRTYALYSITLNLIITFGCASVAGLILWKARREWFHWFTALVLLFIPGGGLWEFSMVSRIAFPYMVMGSLLWPTFLLFLYLFPSGRAAPRWTYWIMAGLIPLHLGLQSLFLLATLNPTVDMLLPPTFLFPIVMTAFPLILFSQVYRYVRFSTPVERAQIRWFIAGLAFWLAFGWFIGVWTRGLSSNAVTGLGGDLMDLLMLVIPVSIGFGILRYRLYDIDLIIRRTLIYGLLTAALTLLYTGSVLLLQQLFSADSAGNRQSSLSIVVSTLAIAALFSPLRRGIQHFIDRRFYRRHYNAQETQQALAGTLRQEVDLDQVSQHLLVAVQETVQPAYLSLWLRDNQTGPEIERGDRDAAKRG